VRLTQLMSLSIKPTFAHRLSGGLAVFYLLVWFIFGLVYRSAANSSNGRDFIFQDDIKVMSQIAAFKEQYTVQIPDGVIETLIRSGRLNLFLVNHPCGKAGEMCWVSNERMGLEWAYYYNLLLTSRGITHYALTFEGRVKHPLAYMAGGYPQTENLAPECERLKLTLYKNPGKRIPNIENLEFDNRRIQPVEPNDDENLVEAGEYTVWLELSKAELDAQEDWSTPELNKQGGPIPIAFIDFTLRHSVVLIDNSAQELGAITSGRYSYPLTDFLYFSAVTITTTGYGDILPRTTKIRNLVMIQSLLGVITLGAFISSLFVTKNARRVFPEELANHSKSTDGQT
jgi:voltage-gated potassium channel